MSVHNPGFLPSCWSSLSLFLSWPLPPLLLGPLPCSHLPFPALTLWGWQAWWSERSARHSQAQWLVAAVVCKGVWKYKETGGSGEGPQEARLGKVGSSPYPLWAWPAQGMATARPIMIGEKPIWHTPCLDPGQPPHPSLGSSKTEKAAGCQGPLLDSLGRPTNTGLCLEFL